MRMAMALICPLMLGACAMGPTLEQQLATYVGRSETELVAGLGVPVRSYETGGLLFLQFVRQSAVPVEQPQPFFYGPYRYGPWLNYTSYVEVRCDITFALRDRRVESFTLNGQGC
ncbi:hypothetical protein [Roseomonas marmotae]|uniref:Lipoprotein n=1 Tax=Roseomonas marmotae TaxID=2768161 RepID=A0ABS3KAP6_9PROT|nr:hypothetical protein [Roseomonas marmotae]MBO1074087.1 hypothetical protein [Roseomonas marmotae]QTI78870.1 hypothetical protein IAI58_14620 [Roseomonas marmotae]